MRASIQDNIQAVSLGRTYWLQPDEPRVVAVDFKGDDLYLGDETFRTEDGLVRDEDVYEYMERKYGKVAVLDEYM